MTKLLTLLALLVLPSLAQQANWTGPYQPCLNSAELKRSSHMSIGVRYDVADPVVAPQFHRAFDFWFTLLDAEFHDDHSTSCAIAIVDATTAVLNRTGVVARAQLPDRVDFHGWIAVDPKASTYLAEDQAVATWIHEIGHLLGLKHNPSATSLMYYLDVDVTSELDATDLGALASLHAFRTTPTLDAVDFASCNAKVFLHSLRAGSLICGGHFTTDRRWAVQTHITISEAHHAHSTSFHAHGPQHLQNVLRRRARGRNA